MNKLLKLLGEKAYNELKEKLGEEFTTLEQDFEGDKISKEDVLAKVNEKGIEVKETEEEPAESDKNNDNKDDETEDKPAEENTDEESDIEKAASVILLDGWVSDGNINADCIAYKPLKDVIEGLQELVKQADWTAEYKIAIMTEALKQGMYDTNDANLFISIDSLSRDDEGKVIGVKEAFAKLRKEKPHLFKQNTSDNPLDSGFDPVDKKSKTVPKTFAEALQLQKELSKMQ